MKIVNITRVFGIDYNSQAIPDRLLLTKVSEHVLTLQTTSADEKEIVVLAFVTWQVDTATRYIDCLQILQFRAAVLSQ